ncbi:CDP-diacylglycerol--serine O-phosphatidyltransferase [Paenibacillus ehimensis]|uniref:CDP-diacylglycerol--serine O-phosphatidyltransferase n=1 Tax=Paenibacillus ehimensis TaxID=79264 RepID=A0ABT8VBC1_9BACL|nr:CDP-diacylglycerol--serine O-phosphatidyltransferase [Paenibacillus ehimensis]MDO3678296.1 CDP-diacylglycerol--serine O-phosphatidyltransferase [Paenibacillus ehimensis]MEC0210342.1 CDP-diacylglycerol--serine O-phosphatidyltransferase [Paenibacillus ehimensis]
MVRKSIPFVFVAAGLGIGMVSLLLAFHGKVLSAVLLVAIAALLDLFGGYIAEKLELSGEFAKELRSLSELISFGAAPSIIIYVVALRELPVYGTLLTALFMVCGALRLARFNVKTCQNRCHIGLPITGAGCLLSAFALWNPPAHLLALTVMVIVGLSFLMISTIKIPAFRPSKAVYDTENV